jgi:tRNA-specific 2-thiouridylase
MTVTKRTTSSGKKVYVAMSGGVDSSVAAALLKARGFHVVGVFMKPWQPRGSACLWRRDREDALRVCSSLDIPLHTWDFSSEYGQKVAGPMIRGYKEGITPNPDVECNRLIKFGLFYDRAMREGADYVATGHYARIRSSAGRHWIAAAADGNKDQTYFLWGLRPRCLGRTLFPLGELTKPQVRRIARQMGLSVADKKDSQGVCFVGPIHFRDFLRARVKGVPGEVVDVRGRRLGTHEGDAQ